jgi:hypothetical protein
MLSTFYFSYTGRRYKKNIRISKISAPSLLSKEDKTPRRDPEIKSTDADVGTIGAKFPCIG